MNNAPVYGCEGCRTTGGRMSCFVHGRTVFTVTSTHIQLQPIQPIDWGIIKDMDEIQYGEVLKPIKLNT